LFGVQLKRKDFTISGRAIRYYELGEGTPVLLLHGAGGTAKIWHGLMKELSVRFRAIAPDLPGFGGSEFDRDALTPEGLAVFIERFLRALEINTASVVANSLGGAAACVFAAERPDMVDRLVLISPAGVSLSGEPHISAVSLISKLEALYTSVTGPDAELRNAAYTIHAIGAGGGLSASIEHLLGGIKAHTLILWGEDDRVIPQSHASIFNNAIHGSNLLVIPHAGHLPFVDTPRETSVSIIRCLTT
jgi:pimeloyl-ACP methyl ester carboxylesterase